ncbi:hypothetical protein BDR26DRAFT_852026 [Obelidium mucronatum]|nr:hypothetical protein BDR26DRAFT_852026 [Obelidium mucronatum]
MTKHSTVLTQRRRVSLGSLTDNNNNNNDLDPFPVAVEHVDPALIFPPSCDLNIHGESLPQRPTGSNRRNGSRRSSRVFSSSSASSSSSDGNEELSDSSDTVEAESDWSIGDWEFSRRVTRTRSERASSASQMIAAEIDTQRKRKSSLVSQGEDIPIEKRTRRPSRDPTFSYRSNSHLIDNEVSVMSRPKRKSAVTLDLRSVFPSQNSDAKRRQSSVKICLPAKPELALSGNDGGTLDISLDDTTGLLVRSPSGSPLVTSGPKKRFSKKMELTFEKLLDYIVERWRIQIKKDHGILREKLTTDKVFRRERFCCIRREDDATSKFMIKLFQGKNPQTDPTYLFNIWFHRFLSNIPAISEIGYVTSLEQVVGQLHAWIREGFKFRPNRFISSSSDKDVLAAVKKNWDFCRMASRRVFGGEFEVPDMSCGVACDNGTSILEMRDFLAVGNDTGNALNNNIENIGSDIGTSSNLIGGQAQIIDELFNLTTGVGAWDSSISGGETAPFSPAAAVFQQTVNAASDASIDETIKVAGTPEDFVAQYVDWPRIPALTKGELFDFLRRHVELCGTFHAYQDCNDAVMYGAIPDDDSFCIPGPGAVKGLKLLGMDTTGAGVIELTKLLNVGLKDRWLKEGHSESEYLEATGNGAVRKGLLIGVVDGKEIVEVLDPVPILRTVDTEHTLCEFQKYLRFLANK